MSTGIHFNLGPRGLGDKIILTSLPENFYASTGEKLVDLDKCWAFDHNPYVIRGDDLRCDNIVYPSRIPGTYTGPLMHSAAQRIGCFLGLEKCPLRHPRFYIHEDLPTIPNRIVIHVQGKKAGAPLHNDVIDKIIDRYGSSFDIFQIGALTDKDTPFKDRRGLSIWESISILSQASIFIGVDSSMMNAAAAYPRINRKIFITRYSREELEKLVPLGPNHIDHVWLDSSCQYYNLFTEDVGVTYGYKKI